MTYSRTLLPRLVCGLSFLGCFLSGCSSLPGAGSTVSGGRTYATAVCGTGRPVVVFESGLGDGMESWAKVVPEVGTFATAFAYNRAGYPGSGIRVSPHAGAEVIEELRALLLAQGLPPPYVLVGHSLGGLYFQLYVRTYPSEVAGLVLVDPTHQDQLRHLRQKMPAQYALISTNLNLGVGATSAEWRGMAETERQTRAAGAPPAVPVILLSGRKTLPLVEGPDFAELKLKLHGEIVAQFVGAQHRILDDSGHYVQRDRPDAVVQAIRDVIARPVVRQ